MGRARDVRRRARGADALYLVPPAFRLDHAPLGRALAERAAEAGVRRVVVLSARGAELDPESPLSRLEEAVAAAGLPTTIVRPTWFAQNFTEAFFRPSIDASSSFAMPAGDGRVPFVDAEDIAAVVVAALTDARHEGEVYALSGPRAIGFAEAATILSEHAGRPLAYVDVAADAWTDAAIEAGTPPEYARLLAGLAQVIRAGGEAPLSDGVRRALGREPVSFEAWAARDAGALQASATAAA